ncbi:hypothetical protein CCACVL1_10114 [Corchorus capsularis]|uniref:Uncharacterized protein n=1 Tax=Corchorus capsularis TaxID=210143 RepID=A0A1R3ISJ8_COCAP|nr:hypothetical protein CCACVL1_10114 [Corchorus capsularis]
MRDSSVLSKSSTSSSQQGTGDEVELLLHPTTYL